MKVWTRIKRWLRRPKRTADPDMPQALQESPLREFVYLDEVSLRSLLSSQTGEVTDSTSEQLSDALSTELSGTIGANPGLVAKAELASKFQTSNSSSIQTSRKATVQSWFREFHAISGLRRIEPTSVSGPADDIPSLEKVDDPALALKSADLRRGDLVEFRVRLKADPVFHLGTMVSEFSAMAEDFPDMFEAGNGLESLREAQPVNKILQRLLAGLIPIRAEAIDYSVAVVNGTEYVVHNELIEGLPLDDVKHLEIVGVTEHIAYWKDIRRVLFSDAEFTLLARVARSGLEDSWTPVKLADLFRQVAPGLIDQINSASREPFDGTPQLHSPASAPESALTNALMIYSDSLLKESGKKLVKAGKSQLAQRVNRLESLGESVSDQRTAFRSIRELLDELSGVAVTPERDLELRETARTAAGLPIFPALAHGRSTAASTSVVTQSASAAASERLLDVDVIAIYW
ncbi:DUF6414 family protein [Isoptericola sp. NPDC055881]